MGSSEFVNILRSRGDVVERQALIDSRATADAPVVLRGTDLSGCDLSGLFLVHVSMFDVGLQGCMCNSTFFGPLTGCVLDKVIGNESRFGRMERCRLRHARLDNVRLGARISKCDFYASSLRFGIFGTLAVPETGIHSHFFDNDFSCSDLFGFDAAGAYLAGSRFEAAQIKNARFSRADLSRCVLDATSIVNSNFVSARALGATFNSAVLEKCLVAPEHLEIIQNSKPSVMTELEVVSSWSGVHFRMLQELLEQCPEYRISWKYTHPRLGSRQKLFLSKDDDHQSLPSIAVFQLETRECIRFYSGESATIAQIMTSVSDDYQNWDLDVSSIRIMTSEAGMEKTIDNALRDLLTNMRQR